MKPPIKPLAGRVVAIRVEAQTKTASGIYLPDASKEKPAIALVVAVGPEVKTLKVDDKIVYKDYATTELTIDATQYLIVKEEDVLATL
jgi:chaperonin GroES